MMPTVVAWIRHTVDSQRQIMVLTFRQKSLILLQSHSLGSAAVCPDSPQSGIPLEPRLILLVDVTV